MIGSHRTCLIHVHVLIAFRGFYILIVTFDDATQIFYLFLYNLQTDNIAPLISF